MDIQADLLQDDFLVGTLAVAPGEEAQSAPVGGQQSAKQAAQVFVSYVVG